MVFKSLRFQLLFQIFILTILFSLSTWFLTNKDTINLGLLSIFGAIIQTIALIHSVEKSQRDIINFLGFIQYDDFTVSYPNKNYTGISKQLYDEYNKVIKKFRKLRTEKESNLHFFSSILHHIDIGILAFNQMGEIKLVNTKALRILNLDRISNLKIINQFYPQFYESLINWSDNEKRVFKLGQHQQTIAISVSSSDLIINGEKLKILSIQNIQRELEDKEMEAWQNMIRVMTHEIMNSLTPITSLSETIYTEMGQWYSRENDRNTISIDETTEIFQALNTIQNRSRGLLHFVTDFRNLSQIPKPKLKLFALITLLEPLVVLFKNEFEKNHITVDLNINPSNLHLMADIELLELVIINMLKNAIDAFILNDNIEKKYININAFHNNKSKTEIWIQDNGSGIEEEVLEKIFIPFFSTKKNGSGIGLTISKQIMRMHQGSINISSEKGKGTLVKMLF